MTMEFRTMSHRSSVLAKSLNCALETFTFGNCCCIDLVAFCEDISFNYICKVVFLSIVKFELANESLTGYACFVKVTFLCFVYTMSVSDFFFTIGIFVNNFLFFVNETNLYSAVSIVINSFDLCNVRTDQPVIQ